MRETSEREGDFFDLTRVKYMRSTCTVELGERIRMSKSHGVNLAIKVGVIAPNHMRMRMHDNMHMYMHM